MIKNYSIPNWLLKGLKDLDKENLEKILKEIELHGIPVSNEVKKYMLKEIKKILDKKEEI